MTRYCDNKWKTNNKETGAIRSCCEHDQPRVRRAAAGKTFQIPTGAVRVSIFLNLCVGAGKNSTLAGLQYVADGNAVAKHDDE